MRLRLKILGFVPRAAMAHLGTFFVLTAAGAFAVSGPACGSDGAPLILNVGGEDAGGTPGNPGTGGLDASAIDGSFDAGPPPRGKRPSRSSTVAINDDDTLVAMVNPDDNSVSIFRAAEGTLLARVATGVEPSQLVFHPSGKTLFVANRAAATVVRVDAADTASPVVSSPIAVGAEPTGLALTPSGNKLYVAEFAESRVSVIDTATMQVATTIAVNNPRAVVVTNNLDASDSDETVAISEFYGEPTVDGETFDTGRVGRVRMYSVQNGGSRGVIALRPFVEGATTSSANQLSAMAISGTRLYVPTISVSPSVPLRYDANVRPVVYVADTVSIAEVSGADGTSNLRSLAAAQLPAPSFALGDLVDMDFVPGSRTAYVISRAADVVQRVNYDTTGITLGNDAAKQIDLVSAGARCTPTGIALAASGMRAYVNCLTSRKLAVIDLASQTVLTTIEATAAPTTDAARVRGRGFFFTGRGRWSQGTSLTRGGEGWSSCGSCHPDGLSDNVTWVFGAGPRQSTSLDGSFSHGMGPQKQRVFNWTAIIDEVHDFEANTRGVSGGRGAIYNAPTVGDCADPSKETYPTLSAGAAAPTATELQAQNRCANTDWDDIESFIKTIRPPRGRRTLDAASVARGAAIFASAGCVNCHGGAGWTVSTRAYVPSTTVVSTLTATRVFTKPAVWPASYTDHSTRQIATQPAVSENGFAIGPVQVACVIRKVGTFGYPGDASRTDLLEVKSDGTRAQGAGGYNVPSLYGLSVGAPYLHHGLARNLSELLTDTRFVSHLKSGLSTFAPTPAERADLIAFLFSIDADTATIAVPTGYGDGCAPN